MSGERMAKAIFTREFHWRRPGSRYGFGAQPSEAAQSFPRDFVAAAVAAGAAEEVPARAGRGGATEGEKPKAGMGKGKE